MITERAVVAAMAQALRVPVTAASATGTHLETGFRIRLALHAADRLPVARAAKPMPLNQPAPIVSRKHTVDVGVITVAVRPDLVRA